MQTGTLLRKLWYLNDFTLQNLNSFQVHRAYNMALVSLCDTGLIGLILMFLSVSLSGLLFTALVWCNSHTWIYFKHKGRYIKVDDQVQHSQNG